MKSLLFSSLVAALAVTACGTSSENQAPAPVAKQETATTPSATVSKEAMASELEALPAGAVVRVPVDEKGNEQKGAAQMHYVATGEKADASNVETQFDSGAEAGLSLGDASGLGNNSAASYDGNNAGFDDSYGYSSYRPRILSRVLRGAAWVLTRPVVWTVRGFRYYYYNRPDCGCYSYDTTYGSTGNGAYAPQKDSTYVDVSVKGKTSITPTQQPYNANQQPYAPTQNQPSYVPQTYAPQTAPGPTQNKPIVPVVK